jgi:hypothetical protein
MQRNVRLLLTNYVNNNNNNNNNNFLDCRTINLRRRNWLWFLYGTPFFSLLNSIQAFSQVFIRW